MEKVNFENLVSDLKSGKIINDGKNDIFVLNSGEKFNIHIDSNENKYIYLKNPFNEYGMFTFNIEDTVTCIRNSYGDVLIQKNIFVKTEHVIYFLDRKIGEEYRTKFINGWKNTEFSSVYIVNNIKFDIHGDFIYDNTVYEKVTKEQLKNKEDEYLSIARKIFDHIQDHDDVSIFNKELKIPMITELVENINHNENRKGKMKKVISYGSVIYSEKKDTLHFLYDEEEYL